MLAQMTYIHTFIMADSENEFMPIFFAASAASVAMSQRKPRRKKHSKRFWSRPFLDVLFGPFWSCVLVCLSPKIASCANVTQHTTLWTV